MTCQMNNPLAKNFHSRLSNKPVEQQGENACDTQ